MEGVRVVREQNVRHIAPYQVLHATQSLNSEAIWISLALIVHTNQVQLRTAKADCSVFFSQQRHSRLREQFLRVVFRLRINFVIAVASVHAKWRSELANLVDTLPKRIAGAGNEIARH